MTSSAFLNAEELANFPKYKRWMTEKQFREGMAKIRSGTSKEDAAALFMILSSGAPYLEKPKADAAVGSWSDGQGGFNAGGFQATQLGAKSAVGFGFFFLYAFAPFSTYFFFLRAPLLIYLGIDLLPGQPRFWEH